MDKKVVIGLVLTLIIIIFIPVYWATEGGRQQAALERQKAEAMERGAHIYVAQCARCHGEAGEGLVGPALKDTALDKESLEKIIARGAAGGAMPAWGEEDGGPLKKHQIWDLVTFLQNWDSSLLERVIAEVKGITPPTTPGDLVAAGKQLFSANCAVCHGQNAEGTNIAPTLVGVEEAAILKQVREGGESMPPFSTDQLSDEDLSKIVEFLKSLK
jgi:mono/diheme cytochrome c family protein